MSEIGIGYDEVMKLMRPLLNKAITCSSIISTRGLNWSKIFFGLGTPTCATVCETRQGFSHVYEKRKGIGKKNEERGSMRWERDGTSLAIRWKDSRPATMLTTIDSANKYVMVKSKIKSGSTWSAKDIKQPKTIDK